MPPQRSTVSVVLASVLALAASRAHGGQPEGERIYHRACAGCHGDDGAGVARPLVGFDVPIPDLRDCAFSTAEPVADWFAVVHQGGPARGFDRTMPAFGAALTEAEIHDVIDHVHGLCPERSDWPPGELNLPRALVTEKAFPENELVLTSTIALRGPGSVIGELLYEQRIGPRAMFEIAIPFGFLDRSPSPAGVTADGWTGGIGDIAVAVKQAALHSMRSGTILSLGLELVLPTGREDRNLGGGITVFGPFASFGQLLPAGAFLQGQAGVDLPFRLERASAAAFWRAVLGISLVPGRWGRMWSPMIEVLGARKLSGSEAMTSWDLVPEFQVTLNRRRNVRFNAGVDIPLDDRDNRHVQLVAYLLWDWFDGSPLEGW